MNFPYKVLSFVATKVSLIIGAVLSMYMYLTVNLLFGGASRDAVSHTLSSPQMTMHMIDVNTFYIFFGIYALLFITILLRLFGNSVSSTISGLLMHTSGYVLKLFLFACILTVVSTWFLGLDINHTMSEDELMALLSSSVIVLVLVWLALLPMPAKESLISTVFLVLFNVLATIILGIGIITSIIILMAGFAFIWFYFKEGRKNNNLEEEFKFIHNLNAIMAIMLVLFYTFYLT